MAKNKLRMEKMRHAKLTRQKRVRASHKLEISKKKEAENRQMRMLKERQLALAGLAGGSVTHIRTAEEEKQLQATVSKSLPPFVGPMTINPHAVFMNDANRTTSIINPPVEKQEKPNETP